LPNQHIEVRRVCEQVWSVLRQCGASWIGRSALRGRSERTLECFWSVLEHVLELEMCRSHVEVGTITCGSRKVRRSSVKVLFGVQIGCFEVRRSNRKSSDQIFFEVLGRRGHIEVTSKLHRSYIGVMSKSRRSRNDHVLKL